MNERLKNAALNALLAHPIVKREDIINILTSIQNCYIDPLEGNTSNEEYLVNELRYFIDNLRR